MADFDRTKIPDLLTALWQDNDKDIKCFIERNDDSSQLCIEYYCMRARLETCEDCVNKGLFNGCNHHDHQVCYCAEELEFLPLGVKDREQLRRISINFYVGACPHVIYLIEDRLDSLDQAFLQDKMENSYSTVDLIHKATSVKSLVNTKRNISDLMIRSGVFTEHLLLRLGKIHFLTTYLNDFILAKQGIRWTFCHLYTILHLSILNNKTEFLVGIIKHKNMLKRRCLYNILSSRICKYENTILYMAMERDLIHVLLQILNMVKRVDRKGAYDVYQLALKTTLWGSIAMAKVDCLKILLRSRLLLFEYRRESGSGTTVDDSRIQSFSLMVQNDRVGILDLLMDCPGFDSYLVEVLPLTVMYGNVRMCERILKRFSKYYNTESRRYVDLYTVAVLQNYPEVLKVLLNYKVPPFQCVKFTALDFAKSFQREKCCNILRRANHDSLEYITDFSPLLEVQKLDSMDCMKTLTYVYLVEELVRKGFNVNFEDQNGITPVQMAIKRRDYNTVRVLLQNGADLFRGQSFMVQYGTMRLVTEVVHCNVDCYNNLSTILEVATRHTRYPTHRVGNIVRTDREKITYLFIFNSLHSLSARDIIYLGKYYKEDMRSLQELSRISLRRYFWRYIHKFVSRVTIPEPLRRFLLLSDAIEEFKSNVILK